MSGRELCFKRGSVLTGTIAPFNAMDVGALGGGAADDVVGITATQAVLVTDCTAAGPPRAGSFDDVAVGPTVGAEPALTLVTATEIVVTRPNFIDVASTARATGAARVAVEPLTRNIVVAIRGTSASTVVGAQVINGNTLGTQSSFVSGRSADAAFFPFNGAGNVRLGVATNAPDRIAVFELELSGNSVQAPDIALEQRVITKIGMGDFEGDANDDVAVLAEDRITVVAPNQNNSSITLSCTPSDFVAGDVDRNGLTDYIAVCPSTQELRLAMNAFTFNELYLLSINVTAARAVVLADADGDGTPEIVVSGRDRFGPALIVLKRIP